MANRLLALASLLVTALGGVAAAGEPRPLEALRWQSRVIVVLADSADDPALHEQESRLGAAAADLVERDVVRVTAAGDSVRVAGAGSLQDLDAGQLRRAYAGGTAGFQVLLLGKDGDVKLRAAEPVAAGDLFALIDSMPMRRREMRERG